LGGVFFCPLDGARVPELFSEIQQPSSDSPFLAKDHEMMILDARKFHGDKHHKKKELHLHNFLKHKSSQRLIK